MLARMKSLLSKLMAKHMDWFPVAVIVIGLTFIIANILLQGYQRNDGPVPKPKPDVVAVTPSPVVHDRVPVVKPVVVTPRTQPTRPSVQRKPVKLHVEGSDSVFKGLLKRHWKPGKRANAERSRRSVRVATRTKAKRATRKAKPRLVRRPRTKTRRHRKRKTSSRRARGRKAVRVRSHRRRRGRTKRRRVKIVSMGVNRSSKAWVRQAFGGDR